MFIICFYSHGTFQDFFYVKLFIIMIDLIPDIISIIVLNLTTTVPPRLSVQKTNRKSYLASQTQPLVCYYSN